MTSDPTPDPSDDRPATGAAAAPVNPLNDPTASQASSLLNPARTGDGSPASDEAGESRGAERTTTSRAGGAQADVAEAPTPDIQPGDREHL